jgi:hypothetical protein
MLSRLLATALFVALIAGCSPAVTKQEGKMAGAQAVTCTSTTPTGSNMPRRKCTTAAEREAQRAESQRTLEERVFRPSHNNGGATPSSAL